MKVTDEDALQEVVVEEQTTSSREVLDSAATEIHVEVTETDPSLPSQTETTTEQLSEIVTNQTDLTSQETINFEV